nr:MAG TPA: hypothetical protein [Caudoviricetes sp.]
MSFFTPFCTLIYRTGSVCGRKPQRYDVKK